MSDTTRNIYAAAILAAAFLFAPPASAKSPVRGRVTVAPTLGQTVFEETPLTRTALRYEAEGGLAIDRVQASATFGLVHWLSDRGDQIDRVILADTTVEGGYDLLSLPWLKLTPRMEVVLPSSKHSNYQTLWFASHLGADADLVPSPHFRVRGRVRLRRDAHRSITPDRTMLADGYADPGPFGFRAAGSRLAGREDAALGDFRPPPDVVNTGPVNVAWGTHMAMQLQAMPFGGFIIDAGFGWTHTWSYVIERPDNVIANEQPKRYQYNIHTGSFGLSWWQRVGAITLGIRAGTATTGRPESAEGRLRFPWWNLEDVNFDDSIVDTQFTVLF